MQHSALQLHVYPCQGEECVGCFKDSHKGIDYSPSSNSPQPWNPVAMLRDSVKDCFQGLVSINIMVCTMPPPLNRSVAGELSGPLCLFTVLLLCGKHVLPNWPSPPAGCQQSFFRTCFPCAASCFMAVSLYMKVILNFKNQFNSLFSE